MGREIFVHYRDRCITHHHKAVKGSQKFLLRTVQKPVGKQTRPSDLTTRWSEKPPADHLLPVHWTFPTACTYGLPGAYRPLSMSCSSAHYTDIHRAVASGSCAERTLASKTWSENIPFHNHRKTKSDRHYPWNAKERTWVGAIQGL